MAEPLTWLVLEHVAAIVRRILVADGYRTDLGAGTVTTDPRQVDEDPVDAYTTVVGGDFSNPADGAGQRTVRTDWDVVIDYAVPLQEGVNAELLAHRGRADILRALHTDTQQGRPAGLLTLKVSGSGLGPPETGAAVVVAQVTLRASLSESFLPA